MSVNTTTTSQPTAPLTAMAATRERYLAHLPARSKDEQARYAELDAARARA